MGFPPRHTTFIRAEFFICFVQHERFGTLTANFNFGGGFAI
jgi:hypothetical protein